MQHSFRPASSLLHTALAGALAPLLFPLAAAASPQGGVVAHGSAHITQNGNLTTITQNTDRAVLDWQKFNLGVEESAKFIQPSVNSVAVNRIHDTAASEIHGSLSANGQIVLINPNGILFSRDARVDVGGIIASSASPTDKEAKDFADGKRNTLPLSIAGERDARIVNAGTITARNAGLVGLVAPQVENSGIIRATRGSIQLASGSTATLDLYGDGLVALAMDNNTQHQLIAQKGLIEADGGTVLLSAAAGEQLVSSVIQMSGIIQARTIDKQQGRIILEAHGSNGTTKQGSSTVTISGKLDASSASGVGGTTVITGDAITLASSAKINASGKNGGGSVKIGGNYQGKGALQNARSVTMEKGASITADALQNGNGGRIILWSDKRTAFGGDISARGGALGGNGGFVETSGKDRLNVSGLANLTAANGAAGTWLLDPTDLTFNSSGGAGDQDNSFTTTQLQAMGAGGNIVLAADNNIYFNMGNETVTLGGGHSLQLTAGNSMTALAGGGFTTSGGGGITLSAGNGIDIGLLSLTTTGNGNVVLNAGTGNLKTGALSLGTGNLSLIADEVDITQNLNSGGGTLFLAPFSNEITVRLNHGGNDFSLTSDEIAYLQHGWNHITIGNANSTQGSGSDGLTFIGDTNWNTDVTFASNATRQMGGSLNLTNNASVTFLNGFTETFNNIITDGGNVNFSSLIAGRGAVALNGNTITTDGGDANFQSLIAVQNTNRIDTDGGNITFAGKISETYRTSDINLTLDAGAGDVSFGGVVYGAFGGGRLNLTVNGKNISFADTLGFGSNHDGEWKLGNVSLTSDNTNIDLKDIRTYGNLTINAGAGTITTEATNTNTGDLTLIAKDLEINDTLAGSGKLLIQTTQQNQQIRLNFYHQPTDMNISADEIARMQGGWENITFDGSNAASSSLIGLSSWDTDLIIKTPNVTHYEALTFTDGASFTFDGNYYDTHTTIATDGGNATFNGVYTGYTNSGITTEGGDLTFNSSVRINHGTGVANFDTSDGINPGGTISLNDIFVINGTGAGRAMTLNAGTGAIHFTNTVNGGFNLTANAGSMDFTHAVGGTERLGNVSLTSVSSLSLPSIAASTLLARTTGTTGDIILNSGKILSATGTGNALTLVANRNFINNAGANALATPTAGARWLVYSTSVAGTTGEENLTSSFRRYSCSFSAIGHCTGGTILVPTTGNGLIYKETPILTAAPNTQNIIYGNNANLSGYAYTISGYYAGDIGLDSITGSINGASTYSAGSNVGTYNINHLNGSLASAMGYNVQYANKSNALNVTPRTISAALSGVVSKAYDGLSNAVLTLGNYTLAGLFGNDAVSIANTSGTYDTPAAGTGKTVTVSGLTLSGAKAGNYQLASSTIHGTVGTITAAVVEPPEPPQTTHPLIPSTVEQSLIMNRIQQAQRSIATPSIMVSTPATQSSPNSSPAPSNTGSQPASSSEAQADNQSSDQEDRKASLKHSKVDSTHLSLDQMQGLVLLTPSLKKILASAQ